MAEDEPITAEEEAFCAAVEQLDATMTRVETGVEGLREGVGVLLQQTTELSKMMETHLSLFAEDKKRRQNRSEKSVQPV